MKTQFNLNSGTILLQPFGFSPQLNKFVVEHPIASRVASSSLGKILIVDRDSHITDLLQCNLRAEGYDTDVHPDAATVLLLDLSDTRVIIIDAFSTKDGVEALRQLSSSPETAHIGIIVCSAGESPGEAITALDAGADDYIPKPFSLREMIARVRAVMRRRPIGAVSSGSVATIGPLSVNYTTRTATLYSRPLSLTPTEYAILALLLKNRDRHLAPRDIPPRVDRPRSRQQRACRRHQHLPPPSQARRPRLRHPEPLRLRLHLRQPIAPFPHGKNRGMWIQKDKSETRNKRGCTRARGAEVSRPPNPLDCVRRRPHRRPAASLLPLIPPPCRSCQCRTLCRLA